MIEEKVRNLHLTKLSPSDKNFAIDNLDILHQNSLLSSSGVQKSEHLCRNVSMLGVSLAGSFNY